MKWNKRMNTWYLTDSKGAVLDEISENTLNWTYILKSSMTKYIDLESAKAAAEEKHR